MNPFDMYIVGLGGQGVLTIGDLLAQAGLRKGIDVNFYPSKGMSQRGGFVQGQLRFGRPNCGPSLTPGSANLVVSMERSEALKGIRYAQKGGDFLLYDDAWYTTAVIMNKAAYPSLETVIGEIKKTGSNLFCLKDETLPAVDGVPVRPNMFILGALLANTRLKELFTLEDIFDALQASFPKNVQPNIVALNAGYNAKLVAE